MNLSKLNSRLDSKIVRAIGWWLEFLAAYAIVAWLSWIPNLLVAEWMIQRNNPLNMI